MLENKIEFFIRQWVKLIVMLKRAHPTMLVSKLKKALKKLKKQYVIARRNDVAISSICRVPIFEITWMAGDCRGRTSLAMNCACSQLLLSVTCRIFDIIDRNSKCLSQ